MSTAVYVVSSVEILAHLIVLPITGLNLYAIGTTSVIHFNLKTILQCQSIAILLVCTSRPAIVVTTEWRTGQLSPDTSGVFTSISTFGLCLVSFVGYAMAVERCYATWKVRSYEQNRSKCFVVFCLAIMVMAKMGE
jgi:Serpentine type 7TM GPCR receptor class ab chemoreceptor